MDQIPAAENDRRRDDIPIRSVRAAIDMLHGDYAPLTWAMVLVSAHLAVWRALLADPTASETALCVLAHAALIVERDDARAYGIKRAQLLAGIQRLSLRQQEVLDLLLVRNCSEAEIAAILKISREAVDIILTAAFKELRQDGRR